MHLPHRPGCVFPPSLRFNIARIGSDAVETGFLENRSDIVQHDAAHALRHCLHHDHRHQPAHGCADQGNPVEVQVIEQGGHVADIGYRGIVFRVWIAVGFAAPAHVHCHELVAVGQGVDHGLEILMIPGQAVHAEHGQRRIVRSVALCVKLQSVGGFVKDIISHKRLPRRSCEAPASGSCRSDCAAGWG